MQRVFVKVIGFDDVERHALNTLFRLSQERETSYSLWQAELGVAAQVALIDSDSYEARLAFESPSNADLKMVWVGPDAPEGAWRSFPRPVQWADVVAAMDDLFKPPPEVDFDLSTRIVQAQAATEPEPRRALIASADRDERLYIRARLALAKMTQADEAETAADLLELLRQHRYEVAFVDFGLPGQGGWDLLRRLRSAEPRIPHVIVTKEKVTARERVKALMSGVDTLLAKPADPDKIKALLKRM
ncbi:MAG TPA: response regulator [Ramlibacter sp.]|nr:response regulator [Ramlibacter sp.]